MDESTGARGAPAEPLACPHVCARKYACMGAHLPHVQVADGPLTESIEAQRARPDGVAATKGGGRLRWLRASLAVGATGGPRRRLTSTAARDCGQARAWPLPPAAALPAHTWGRPRQRRSRTRTAAAPRPGPAPRGSARRRRPAQPPAGSGGGAGRGRAGRGGAGHAWGRSRGQEVASTQWQGALLGRVQAAGGSRQPLRPAVAPVASAVLAIGATARGAAPTARSSNRRAKESLPPPPLRVQSPRNHSSALTGRRPCARRGRVVGQGALHQGSKQQAGARAQPVLGCSGEGAPSRPERVPTESTPALPGAPWLPGT
jgi:hypothetical protein